MRIGKPGRWWLLVQLSSGSNVPIFWTGEWTGAPRRGDSVYLPMFTLSADKALQFDSSGSAIFAASVFGLKDVAPIAFDFAKPGELA